MEAQRWVVPGERQVRLETVPLPEPGPQEIRVRTEASLVSAGTELAIYTGILLGLTMFLNVWGVIWRNQKIVIANARNVQAGGEADPNAAAAGRKALLASRQNTIYSFTLLMFMVGTAHFFLPGKFKIAPSGSDRALYWAIAGIIWLVLELNALGVIGGTIGALNGSSAGGVCATIAVGALAIIEAIFLAAKMVIEVLMARANARKPKPAEAAVA